MTPFLIIAPLLVGVALGGYDAYGDLAQLYRMQLLAEAFGDYSPNTLGLDQSDVEIRSQWPDFAASLDEAAAAKAPVEDELYGAQAYSGAQIRDPEQIEHSALHGYQSVSGGNPEGPSNTKQQKTDKPLPAYCNPPNPCPVGKTAKDNCVENFENSAENNKKLLSEQDCPCDTEHMFSCPAGKETVSSKGQSGYQQTLNKVIDQLNKIGSQDDQENGSPPKTQISLVAKKSPHIIHKRSEWMESANPYLKGAKMKIAAKKSFKDARESMKDLMERWMQQHGDQI